MSFDRNSTTQTTLSHNLSSIIGIVLKFFVFHFNIHQKFINFAHEARLNDKTNTMTIAIINAMHKEHEQIVALLSDVKHTSDGKFSFVEGELHGKHLVLMESGIGKVNAAVGAVELIHRYHPDALINTGVAGGIDPKLGVMDVVAGSRCRLRTRIRARTSARFATLLRSCPLVAPSGTKH